MANHKGDQWIEAMQLIVDECQNQITSNGYSGCKLDEKLKNIRIFTFEDVDGNWEARVRCRLTRSFMRERQAVGVSYSTVSITFKSLNTPNAHTEKIFRIKGLISYSDIMEIVDGFPKLFKDRMKILKKRKLEWGDRAARKEALEKSAEVWKRVMHEDLNLGIQPVSLRKNKLSIVWSALDDEKTAKILSLLCDSTADEITTLFEENKLKTKMRQFMDSDL